LRRPAASSQAARPACLFRASAPTGLAAYAVVTGVDLGQQPVIVAGDGDLARCLQHETDHLKGELYIDALTGTERREVMRALRGQQLVSRGQSIQ
jgi:peptide deformylase